MPCERGVVSHHAAAAHAAVVRHVGVGHEQVVAADFGDAAALRRAAIHGGEFTEHIAIADFEARGFAGVFEILRRIADGGELEDLVARADGRLAVDHRMRSYPGAGPYAHTIADDGVRTYRDIGGNLGLGRNDGARIDATHVQVTVGEVLLVSGATIISAEVTTSSPT
jgi:hypothetical protein